MADVSAILVTILTVGGGCTLLSVKSGALPARTQRTEQTATLRAVPTPSHTSRVMRRAVIPRDADGLFYVDATINGASIHFLVDTGSNMVVLSPQDAARAGVAPGRAIGSLNTAAGSMSSAMTRIRTTTIAGRELHDVAAMIPSVRLGVSLLGQNALAEIGEVRIGRSTLTLG